MKEVIRIFFYFAYFNICTSVISEKNKDKFNYILLTLFAHNIYIYKKNFFVYVY